MTIDEVFELAEDYCLDSGFKFKVIDPPENMKDVTFIVIDAFFGFAVYEGSEGFITKGQFKNLFGAAAKYKEVK